MRTFRASRRSESGAAHVGVTLAAVGVLVASAGAGFAFQRVVLDDGGTGDPTSSRAPVPVFECPGDPVVADVHDGDRVFAVAVHDELDGWLLIRNPQDPDERWWIEGRFVAADRGTDHLEAIGCGDEPASTSDRETAEVAAGPDDEAGTDEETTTTTSTGTDDPATGSTTDPSGQPPGPIVPTPPPTGGGSNPPPPPPPSTTTTDPGPAPDTTGPSLTVSRAPTAIWETYPGLCQAEPKQATITASASDPSGVKSIRATWSVGNHNENKSLAGGSATFGPYAYGTVPDGSQQTVTVTVTATDNADNVQTKTTTIVVHSAAKCFG